MEKSEASAQPKTVKNTSQKVKVAFFADILIKDFDGAIKTMYQLINRIPTDRFEYMFVTGMKPQQKFPHKILKVPTMTVPFNKTYKIALPNIHKKKVLRKLNEFKPDVIHIATPSPLGFFGREYALANKIPILSIYHTHFISYMQYYFRNRHIVQSVKNLSIRLYRKFYNSCNLIYVPTNLMIDELADYGVERKRMQLWQRGLNTDIFNPQRRDPEYLYNITGNNKPCLLYASRLVYEKNITLLFDIYDLVEQKGIDINWIVVGYGVAEAEARQRMPKAFFMGKMSQTDLGKMYASTDIFVFPSISETYGNVVMEAMVCGCIPVIARGGGSQALVEDGVNGFLCRHDSAEDFVDKINILLHNASLCESMRKEGEKNLSQLSWERLSDKYFSDIEHLATEKAKESV